MTSDEIRAVWIDEDGRLFVKPHSHRFPHIYREAAEVHWDEEQSSLVGPAPREWSYFDWFKHIVGAAQSQGCRLRASARTKWRIPPDLQSEIQAWLA
jgi:hypothetical protein